MKDFYAKRFEAVQRWCTTLEYRDDEHVFVNGVNVASIPLVLSPSEYSAKVRKLVDSYRTARTAVR